MDDTNINDTPNTAESKEDDIDSVSSSGSSSSGSGLNPSEWIAQLEEEVRQQQQGDEREKEIEKGAKDNCNKPTLSSVSLSLKDKQQSIQCPEVTAEKNTVGEKEEKEGSDESYFGVDTSLSLGASNDNIDYDDASGKRDDVRNNNDEKKNERDSESNITKKHKNQQKTNKNENQNSKKVDNDGDNDNDENDTFTIEIGQSLHSWYHNQSPSCRDKWSQTEYDGGNDLVTIRHDYRGSHRKNNNDKSNILLTVPSTTTKRTKKDKNADTASTTNVQIVYTSSSDNDMHDCQEEEKEEEEGPKKKQMYTGQGTLIQQYATPSTAQGKKLKEKTEPMIDCVAIYDPIRQCHVLEIVNLSISNLKPCCGNDGNETMTTTNISPPFNNDNAANNLERELNATITAAAAAADNMARLNPRTRALEAEKQVRLLKRKRKEMEKKKKKKQEDEKKKKRADNQSKDADNKKGEQENASKEKKIAAATTATTTTDTTKHKRWKVGKTGYHGVSPNPRSSTNPYRAQICIDGKQKFLGSFATAEEAAKKFDKVSFELKRYWLLNFPDDFDCAGWKEGGGGVKGVYEGGDDKAG